MENKNTYKEERFDSFLNKTIILSSKDYFRTQMGLSNKEKTIVDDVNYSTFLQRASVLNETISIIDTISNSIELNNAMKSLSAIEQSVIFLLFEEDLSQDEAAKILEICSKSVIIIKLRAIDKLRKYLKGDLNYEK